MKRMLLGYTFFAYLLTGCNDYTKSVCDHVGRSDFAGYESMHLFRIFAADFEFNDMVQLWKKIGVGTYLSSDGNTKHFTCQIGGETYAEILNEKLGLYNLTKLVPTKEGYDLQFLAFAKSDLEENKIPYKMIIAPSSLLSFAKSILPTGHPRTAGIIGILGEDVEKLLILNDKLGDPASFVKYGRTTSVPMRMIRE